MDSKRDKFANLVEKWELESKDMQAKDKYDFLNNPKDL